jgi:hypothetical protein
VRFERPEDRRPRQPAGARDDPQQPRPRPSSASAPRSCGAKGAWPVPSRWWYARAAAASSAPTAPRR